MALLEHCNIFIFFLLVTCRFCISSKEDSILHLVNREIEKKGKKLLSSITCSGFFFWVNFHIVATTKKPSAIVNTHFFGKKNAKVTPFSSSPFSNFHFLFTTTYSFALSRSVVVGTSYHDLFTDSFVLYRVVPLGSTLYQHCD